MKFNESQEVIRIMATLSGRVRTPIVRTMVFIDSQYPDQSFRESKRLHLWNSRIILLI